MWQESLHIFLQQFSSVTTFEDSTHQYTTFQIKQMLESHTGTPVEIFDVCDALKKRGFFYTSVCGSLELEWLFKADEARI